MKGIVVYDHRCSLCNRLIQFIKSRQRAYQVLTFTSSDTIFGNGILQDYQKKADQTVLYYKNNIVYERTSAVRKILYDFGGFYRILSIVLYLIPVSFSNIIYDIISRNRYSWFGKNEGCSLN